MGDGGHSYPPGSNTAWRPQRQIRHAFLWYHQRFKASRPQLTSSQDGIARYPVACTCIGIEVATRELYETWALEPADRRPVPTPRRPASHSASLMPSRYIVSLRASAECEADAAESIKQ